MVGVRHRKDVGDLEPLMASIAKHGLLQPITLTPELVLVCGWRRLEAMRRLGWTHTRPWWRPGLSEDATQVLAEHDENFLQQAYTKSEQATLFRELKTVLQQEAARRQSAHWFTSNSDGPESASTGISDGSEGLDESDECGSGSEPGPEEPGNSGDAREQAAQLVAGRKSYHTLERIGTLMDLAVDPEQPADVRALAADAVARIDEGHPLKPEWARVQAALAAQAPATDGEPGGRSPAAPEHSRPAPVQSSSGPPGVSRAALRAWIMTWRGAAVLLDEHDPAVLGPVLSETDWNTVRDLSQNLAGFLREAQAAREEAGLPATPSNPEDTENRTKDQPDTRTEPAPASGLASVIPIGVRS
ncbi:ParB/RepB/Spo0J family partition protein [Promicromonospora sp. NPDC057138]|uniref:ParB/RepB/Spo0J family partition protein n=1 Tax=Promicromonospora sp. NPDC057138 TaxID=3346031 RepID=UPI0036429053